MKINNQQWKKYHIKKVFPAKNFIFAVSISTYRQMEQVPPEQITTILLQNFQHDFDEILTLIVC